MNIDKLLQRIKNLLDMADVPTFALLKPTQNTALRPSNGGQRARKQSRQAICVKMEVSRRKAATSAIAISATKQEIDMQTIPNIGERVTVRLCGTISEFLYGSPTLVTGIFVHATPDYSAMVIRLNNGREVIASQDHIVK